MRISKASPRLPAHLFQRDPDRRERLGEHPFGLLLRPFERHAQRRERLGGNSLIGAQYPEQEVLVADRVVTQHPGLLHGSHHAPASFLGETVEDHSPFPFLLGGSPGYLSLILLACFLCTACLLTPKTSAICAQDHPATKAFSTCAASKASSVRLKATTASRPCRGSSGQPTRVLVFSSMRQS